MWASPTQQITLQNSAAILQIPLVLPPSSLSSHQFLESAKRTKTVKKFKEKTLKHLIAFSDSPPVCIRSFLVSAL